MTQPLRLAIHGAAGRMGQRVVALAAGDADLDIVAALEGAAHPLLGDDAGLVAGVGALGVPLTDTLAGPADVVIDFSVPDAVELITDRCVNANIPLVVATTGLTDAQQGQLSAAAATIPLVWAPNMSLAVNLAMRLCQVAGETLKDHSSGVDVEILERHHRYKEDAPSGTALEFGRQIAAAMGQTRHVHGREGRPGARTREEIGYHAIRSGDDPGQHTIVFGLLGETIEVRVAATSRDAYAHGALAAAKWLAGKAPGMYGMGDVLGI